MNILFTCAGRRNYLINYFKEAIGESGKTVAIDMSLTAPSLVDADVAIQVPAVYADDYIDVVMQIIKDHEIDAIISLNDLELPILSEHKEELEELGIKVLVSSPQVIATSFDKWKTSQFAKEVGLNHPKTYIDLEKVKKDIESGDLNFPLVVKPRWGSGSIGIEFPNNMEELELMYRLVHLKISKTILKTASSEDADRAVLIQEKIKGNEYGLDVLNDFDSNYFSTVARRKVNMRSGETDKAISVVDPNLEEIGETIGKSLKHLGNLDCDVFEANGKYYLLELNPRFGGGYPFSHEAGMNGAAIYIEWLKGGTDVKKYANYKPDIMFAKCDRLMKVN